MNTISEQIREIAEDITAIQWLIANLDGHGYARNDLMLAKIHLERAAQENERLRNS